MKRPDPTAQRDDRAALDRIPGLEALDERQTREINGGVGWGDGSASNVSWTWPGNGKQAEDDWLTRQ